MGITLFEIEGKDAELFEAMSSEDETTRKQAEDQYAALQELKEEKRANCCGYVKNLRAEVEAIEAEIDRLRTKAIAVQSRLTRFEDYMARCIPHGERWSNGVHSIGYRRSEVVAIIEEKLIPAQYLREKLYYEPDKNLIKQDLKCGATIPGVALQENWNLQVK